MIKNKVKQMEIKIEQEELSKRSIFLAVPMYGGMCSGNFTKSVIDLTNMCRDYNIRLSTYFLFNESLITRARNYCADAFLRSDSTHLMFIDSDIEFDATDVISLLALSSDNSPYDIICAPYPKKAIAWEKIKAAVDQGVADDNPQVLSKYVSDFVVNAAEGYEEIQLFEPTQVLEGGTGFMMIRRNTLEKFREKRTDLLYTPDHVRSVDFDGSRKIMAFFDTEIDPDSNRYLSEDYYFCQHTRKLGMEVWTCPWMKLGHLGSYLFSGSLAEIAQINVHPSADITQKLK